MKQNQQSRAPGAVIDCAISEEVQTRRAARAAKRALRSPSEVATELRGLVVLAEGLVGAIRAGEAEGVPSAWHLLMTRFGEVMGRSQEMASGEFTEANVALADELFMLLRSIAPDAREPGKFGVPHD